MKRKYVNIICFVTLNILVILIFLPWLKGHYATDSYNIMNVGYEYYSIHNSLIDGRLFMFLIMQFASLININFETLHFILLSSALLVSNVCVLFIKNIITDRVKKHTIKLEIFSYIVAYTFVYNFMYIENLYFLECFVMALGILLNIIAAKIFVNKNKFFLIKTFLLVLISIFCYQGTISSFIAFIILLEALKTQDLKTFIKNIIIGTCIVGIACILNFAFVKLISYYLNINQARLSNSILSNILYIITSKPTVLVHLSDMYSHGLFLIFSIIIICLFINSFNFEQNKYRYLIFIFFIILGTLFATDLPYTISFTAFMAARTRFAIGALCSIMLIYIFLNYNKKQKSTLYLLSFISSIWFIINIANYIFIINSAKLVNMYEKEYSLNIANYVEQYEKENNCKIEKIQMVYNYDDSNVYFENCLHRPYITWNACSCSWSAIGTINFYSGKKLVPISDTYIKGNIDGLYQIKNNVLYINIGVL